MDSTNYDKKILLSTTLINSSKEIALPLFLLLEYPTQFRTNEILGKGGAGVVYKGELLDTRLKDKHKIENVAVKFVKSKLFIWAWKLGDYNNNK